ncbi:complement factor B-like [Morone saxatilis]|uniref:complement factor B-like n=1 Tax=Morone saxatilis TaxID=34816 RepID=UPI0015E25110|nr:complement factor B-like [Morone saxatilis]
MALPRASSPLTTSPLSATPTTSQAPPPGDDNEPVSVTITVKTAYVLLWKPSRAQGSSTRVCLPNGKWSGSTPICSHDTGDNCADPGIPPGASRTGNTFGIDDTVRYSCNGNQFLVGSRERVCQGNGQWTGREPACYYKHTYDTSLEVSQEFGSTIKNTLTTLQPVNDTQEGRTIRIQRNGTLNMYIAVDISQSIEEKDIRDAKDAVKKLISKIASFSVNPNYEIIFFSSVVIEVVNILDFFERKQEDILEKLDRFDKGDASGTNLNTVFETFLEQMGLIKRRVGEDAFKEHRHAVIVFTDGAYNMGGSPLGTVKQIKNMVYMNHTVEGEKHPREDYLDIYVFAIGAEIFDDDLQPLTAGTGGKHYFRLKDIENLQETFDEIIDENEVKGLCGLHVEYDTAEANARKMYPWTRHLLFPEQLLLKEHIERLTFLTRTENIVDEKDVHAKLGTNRAGCIRHALQAPGIDTDVVTDVVTDNFLCTGGRTPFRDHIACTGDSGGAVFKNYEHRTIQIALVSWGTKTLCRAGGVVESDDTSRDFHINLFRVVPFLKSILANDDQDDYAPLTFLES